MGPIGDHEFGTVLSSGEELGSEVDHSLCFHIIIMLGEIGHESINW